MKPHIYCHPPVLLVASARPDVFIVRSTEIILLELTIPFNSPESISNAKPGNS